jgi:iron complex transport system substrate-binding protein
MSYVARLITLGVLALVVPLGVLAGGAPETSAAGPTPVAPAQSGYPLTVRDDQGTLVTIDRQPMRIISLTAHTDDILTELVDHRRLIGVSSFAEDPAISNVATKVLDISHKLTSNVEVILSLQPDLLFLANWSEADKVAQLRSAGIPVYLTASPLKVETIAATIRTVARLVGDPARGEEMIARMDRRLQAVWDRVGDLPAGRRKSVLDYSTWGSAQGAGSSWDELVHRAGLVNAVGSLPADQWGQVPLSKEKILELDPDILVLPGWVYGDAAASEAFYRQTVEDPALSTLKAIRQKQVYRLPEGLKAATSQYVADAVEYLARLAYPELFP